MKMFKCEMCGGNELIKEGEFYVCQHCKTKYQKEDAQKLMVEVTGNVNVTNPVEIDAKKFVNDSIKAYDEYEKQKKKEKDEREWNAAFKFVGIFTIILIIVTILMLNGVC